MCGKTARWGRPSRETAAPHDRMWLGGDEMVMMARYVASRVAARVASEEGATAVEYALMLTLIAMAVVAAVTLLGQNTNSAYSNSTLSTALSP